MDYLESEIILRIMVERIRDDKIFRRWIPYQSSISFEGFKAKIITDNPSVGSIKSVDEIMVDVKEILNKVQGG